MDLVTKNENIDVSIDYIYCKLTIQRYTEAVILHEIYATLLSMSNPLSFVLLEMPSLLAALFLPCCFRLLPIAPLQPYVDEHLSRQARR